MEISSQPFILNSEIKGENRPQLSKNIPQITDRYGFDLRINDLSNAEDSLWLNSLIWPGHKERRTLFAEAAECFRINRDEQQFIEGDGEELLPDIVKKVSKSSALCIFHTHVANQMPADAKHKLLANVSRISGKRDVFHIYNNIWDGFLHLDSYINGREDSKVIAETDGHGSWFKWVV